jgi:UPF0755 protein
MKNIAKIILIFFILSIFAGVTVAGYFLNEFYVKRPASGAAVQFVIEPGDSVKEISAELKKAGIIKSRFVFEIYVWLTASQGIFQAGEYSLRPGESMSSLVKILTDIIVKSHRLTLIEGWTIRDMAEYLKEKKVIKNESEFYYLTGRPLADYRKQAVDFKAWNYSFLADKPAYASLEGYIYPDTYYVLQEDGVNGLTRKALNNFDRKLTQSMRDEIKKQGKTIFEIVTMASVIEREVFGLEDRRIVSDIFWRRLKIGMPLQADSTVNYITDSGRDRSTYDDLKIDSPWNTYKYGGLPLGPISNPSIEAITAAIYPAPNQYLYFLTDKEGGVHYGKTPAEHTKNRVKYLD